MPFVTSAERLGYAQGFALGYAQGPAEGRGAIRRAVLQTLDVRFGAVPPEVMALVTVMGDSEMLIALSAWALVAPDLPTFVAALGRRLRRCTPTTHRRCCR